MAADSAALLGVAGLAPDAVINAVGANIHEYRPLAGAALLNCAFAPGYLCDEPVRREAGGVGSRWSLRMDAATTHSYQWIVR